MEGLLAALFAALLGATAIHGRTQPVDCRSCHAPGAASGARDLSHMYAQPALHHPVGVKYPTGVNESFNQPNGRNAGLTFFDRNGNGQPEREEIRLFGNAATVECDTCHQEHGNTTAPVNAVRKHYLRMDNAGSALCSTCHNK